MKRSASLLSVMALVVAMPVAAQAVTPGENFLTNWDYNGDGQVSLSEVLERRGDLFDSFDANSDGVLSAEELAAHNDMRGQMTQQNQLGRTDARPMQQQGYAQMGPQGQGYGRGQAGPGMMQPQQQGGRWAQGNPQGQGYGPGAMQQPQGYAQGGRFAQTGPQGQGYGPNGAPGIMQPQGYGQGPQWAQGPQAQGFGAGPMGQAQPGYGQGFGRGPAMAMQTPQGQAYGPGAGQMNGQGFGPGAQGQQMAALGLDTNGDGTVTRDEFVARGNDWFARFDRDGNGVVLPEDFGTRRW